MDMSSRPGFYEIFRGKDSGKKVTGMNGYVVEMNNIRKSFGSVQAVKDGQFNLRKGEIHSLIGENGTGKSTMMKLLYGLYDFDGGDIKIKGENMAFRTKNGPYQPTTGNPEKEDGGSGTGIPVPTSPALYQ